MRNRNAHSEMFHSHGGLHEFQNAQQHVRSLCPENSEGHLVQQGEWLCPGQVRSPDPHPASRWALAVPGGTLTLQWMTTTCWGSLCSQDSCALQMVHTLSRGGACSSGQPTSRICNDRAASAPASGPLEATSMLFVLPAFSTQGHRTSHVLLFKPSVGTATRKEKARD